MEELLTQIIQAIVDKPDEVDIKVIDTENNKIYELRVGEGDLGKVIGKRGKNKKAKYLVKWKGHEAKTYQPISHLTKYGADEMVEEYEMKVKANRTKAKNNANNAKLFMLLITIMVTPLMCVNF